MCLIIRSKLNVAEKDIVCYKMVAYYNGKLIAPHMDNIICDIDKIEGFEYKPDYFTPHAKKWIMHGIHTFSDLRYAKVRFNVLIGFPFGKLYKCIIPKGSRYFIGDDNDYCSERIIFNKEVKLKVKGGFVL